MERGRPLVASMVPLLTRVRDWIAPDPWMVWPVSLMNVSVPKAPYIVDLFSVRVPMPVPLPKSKVEPFPLSWNVAPETLPIVMLPSLLEVDEAPGPTTHTRESPSATLMTPPRVLLREDTVKVEGSLLKLTVPLLVRVPVMVRFWELPLTVVVPELLKFPLTVIVSPLPFRIRFPELASVPPDGMKS